MKKNLNQFLLPNLTKSPEMVGKNTITRATLLKKLKNAIRKDFCELCGSKAETEGTMSVHHVFRARSDEKRFNRHFMLSLCFSCHEKTKENWFNRVESEKINRACEEKVGKFEPKPLLEVILDALKVLENTKEDNDATRALRAHLEE